MKRTMNNAPEWHQAGRKMRAPVQVTWMGLVEGRKSDVVRPPNETHEPQPAPCPPEPQKTKPGGRPDGGPAFPAIRQSRSGEARPASRIEPTSRPTMERSLILSGMPSKDPFGLMW